MYRLSKLLKKKKTKEGTQEKYLFNSGKNKEKKLLRHTHDTILRRKFTSVNQVNTIEWRVIAPTAAQAAEEWGVINKGECLFVFSVNRQSDEWAILLYQSILEAKYFGLLFSWAYGVSSSSFLWLYYLLMRMNDFLFHLKWLTDDPKKGGRH